MGYIKVLRETSIPMSVPVTTQTWTNMPAALTEYMATTNKRIKADLTNYTQARLIVNVQTAGFAGASLRIQYSTDENAWTYLDAVSGPDCVITNTGVEESTWINITAATKADVYLRIVGINGDGIVDPVFGSIVLELK